MLTLIDQVLVDLHDARRFMNIGCPTDARECLTQVIDNLSEIASDDDKVELANMLCHLEADYATLRSLRVLAEKHTNSQ